MKLTSLIVFIVIITNFGVAQSVDCCDSLYKILNGKKTCIKKNQGQGHDINIAIDNSHSANNNVSELIRDTKTPCPDGRSIGVEQIIDYLFKAITIWIGIYLVFFKSYLGEKGKNLAKLEDIGKITQIIEEAKYEYTNKLEEYKAKLNEELTLKVEPIKSLLQKENISYQISLAELTKIRYVKIEELVLSIIELQNFIRNNMFSAEDEEKFKNNKLQFNLLFDKVDTVRKVCDLYLTDELIKKIIDILNNSHAAYLSFLKMYYTDPKKLGDILPYDLDAQQIRINLSSENFKAYERLNIEIDKFPSILKELTGEFKKQIILKNLNDGSNV